MDSVDLHFAFFRGHLLHFSKYYAKGGNKKNVGIFVISK